MSVAEASRLLRLSEQHVRRLASSGALQASRFPGGWLLDERAVRSRAQSARPAGRPLSEAMSWLLLRSLSEHLVSGQDPHDAHVLPGMEDRKVRYRLRHLIASAPPFDQWPSWLRRRADLRRVWVHPGVLAKMADDSRLHAGGGSVSVSAAAGIAASDQRRFYLRRSDFSSVMADYRAHEDPDGQVDLLLVSSDAADALPAASAPAPLAAGLVDLLESADAREYHAAAEVLAAGVSRLAAKA
jgi:Helix-turn-helix domain